MPGTSMEQYLAPQRSIPLTVPDNTPALGAAAGPYNEQRVTRALPSRQALTDMGLTWVAGNPTVGTGVAYALTTAFNDTTGAIFSFFNGEPAGGKNLYLDQINLWLTAAPTATVSQEWLFKVDPTNRSPTAGNVALAPAFTNLRNPANVKLPTIQAFNAAGLTVPASGAAAVTVARAHIPTSLGIVGDEYQLVFGAENYVPIPGLTATRATAVGRFQGYVPAFGIPPQTWCVAYMWWLTAATTAPSFEYQLSGFWW